MVPDKLINWVLNYLAIKKKKKKLSFCMTLILPGEREKSFLGAEN